MEEFCDCTNAECEKCDIGECIECEHCEIGKRLIAYENYIWDSVEDK